MALLLVAAACGPAVVDIAGAQPAAGVARSCGGIAGWRHGVATLVEAQGMTCKRAKRVIAYAADHGMAKPTGHGPGPGFFVVARRHVLGFRFTYEAGRNRFHARRGHARLSFDLCWNRVDC